MMFFLFFLILCLLVFFFTGIERAVWVLIAISAAKGYIKQLYPGLFSYLCVDILIGFIILYFFFDIRNGILLKSKKPPFLLWIFLYFGVLVVYSFDPEVNFLNALSAMRFRLLTIPLFLIGFYYSNYKISIIKLINVALFIGIFVSLFGIVQYKYGASALNIAQSEFMEERYQFHNFTENQAQKRRAFSTFTSSHEFGMFLAVVMILTFGLIVHEKNHRKRIFYGVSMLIMGIGLVISSTRSGVAMLVIGLLPQILLFFKGRKMNIILILVGIYFSIYCVGQSLTSGFFKARISDGFSPDYLGSRIFGHYFNSVLPAFIESPLGHGLSGNLGYMGNVLDINSFTQIEGFYANTLFQIGIFGFGIILILFSKIILECYHALKRAMVDWSQSISVAFFGVILACTIENIAGGSIQTDSIGTMFWLSVGILVRLGNTASFEWKNIKGVSNTL